MFTRPSADKAIHAQGNCGTSTSWATARVLFADERIKLIRIDVSQGAYSPYHRDRADHTVLVAEGHLLLICETGKELTERTLTPDDGPHTIEAGTEHRLGSVGVRTVAYEFCHAKTGPPAGREEASVARPSDTEATSPPARSKGERP